jgi:hypothetical protein
MMNWLKRHATAIQALTGMVTLIVAIAALVGVKVQIDASARLQQEQSARDIYREFLNLSLSNPDFAEPDYCAMPAKQVPGYESYVEYMLYTGEQMLDASPEWEPTLTRTLLSHRQYLCSERGVAPDDPPQLRAFLNNFSEKQCAAWKAPCPER